MKKGIMTVGAFMLTAVLTVVMLAGCNTGKSTGKNGSGEYVKLRVFLRDEMTRDKDLVAEEISKITREKINAEIELVMFGAGEYVEKIPLLLASDEVMDIGYDAEFLGFSSRVKKNVYHDIADYLKNDNKALYDLLPEVLWSAVTYGDSIYGVPTYKEFAEQGALYAEESFLEEVGIDPKSIKTLAEAEVILEKLKASPGRAGFMIKQGAFVQKLASLTEWDMITNLCAVKRDEGNTVVNYFETENYKNFVYLMRDWYNKGYIASDVATLQDYAQYETAGKYGLNTVSYTPYGEVTMGILHNSVLAPILVTPVVATSTSMTGSINSIYKKSKNPKVAMDFLELWNSSPEIKNLITFGIEGKHYNLVDGKVQRVPDYAKLYSAANYRTGNIFISHLLTNEPDDKYDRYKEFNEAAVLSADFGFKPDITSVAAQDAASAAIISEYSLLLNIGAVDPDVYLPKFLTALKGSGADLVVAELQKQYTNWKASQ